MNTLAISNHLVMRLLQGQNTKRVVAKKMNIVESKKNNNTTDKNEDQTQNQNDYVSILMPNIVSNDTAASSLSLPIPNDALPIPYDIHQKASNTLDTENTLNDDSNKNKEEVVINL
jgi:hypothetical protein